MATYALKFISGKYQGGEFPIPDDGELVIGRASDLGLVLVEDMVSRKHAKLTAGHGKLVLTDLGSTNGTYVNGEKIQRREITIHDRILLGTSIVKVVDGNSISLSAEEMADKDLLRRMMAQLGNRAPESSAMSGDLEEVPLPDLLLLFGTNKKTGILSVNGAGPGRIYLKNGEIQCVVMGTEMSVQPMKVLCRMLTWIQGTFHFETCEEALQVPKLMSGSTENVLMEAMRQNDELQRLATRLPPPETALRLRVPLRPRLTDLSASELETLQLAINLGGVRQILDASPAPDLLTATNLLRLMESGYVTPVTA